MVVYGMIGDNWPNEREFGIWNFFCEDGDSCCF